MFRSPKEMFFQTLSAEICQKGFPYLPIGEVTLAGNSAVRRVLSTENRGRNMALSPKDSYSLHILISEPQLLCLFRERDQTSWILKAQMTGIFTSLLIRLEKV